MRRRSQSSPPPPLPQFKWNKYARKLFIFELAIFLFYLACFFTFSLLLAELEIGASWSTMTASGRGTASIVLALIIPLFGVRQMFREGQQIQYHSGKMIEKIVTHLQDGWSFVQLSNALMSIITCILHLASSPATRSVCAGALGLPAGPCLPMSSHPRVFSLCFRKRALASLAAFGLWVQVLYFLRARESTGALVRMIFRVLHLSIPFLFVMLIVCGGVVGWCDGGTEAVSKKFLDLPKRCCWAWQRLSMCSLRICQTREKTRHSADMTRTTTRSLASGRRLCSTRWRWAPQSRNARLPSPSTSTHPHLVPGRPAPSQSTLRVVESTKRVVLVKLLFVTFSVLLSIFMLDGGRGREEGRGGGERGGGMSMLRIAHCILLPLQAEFAHFSHARLHGKDSRGRGCVAGAGGADAVPVREGASLY